MARLTDSESSTITTVFSSLQSKVSYNFVSFLQPNLPQTLQPRVFVISSPADRGRNVVGRRFDISIRGAGRLLEGPPERLGLHEHFIFRDLQRLLVRGWLGGEDDTVEAAHLDLSNAVVGYDSPEFQVARGLSEV